MSGVGVGGSYSVGGDTHADEGATMLPLPVSTRAVMEVPGSPRVEYYI